MCVWVWVCLCVHVHEVDTYYSGDSTSEMSACSQRLSNRKTFPYSMTV